jgi:hypothetical protein
MGFSIKHLCTPASIYFWISFISIVIMILKNFQIMTAIVNLFFVFLWTWVLNYLCSKGYKSVSWFLVLLPIIIFAFVILKNMNISM